MSTEDMQAAIITRVYQGSYGHVENVLVRLRELEATVGHEVAVRVLHAEVAA